MAGGLAEMRTPFVTFHSCKVRPPQRAAAGWPAGLRSGGTAAVPHPCRLRSASALPPALPPHPLPSLDSGPRLLPPAGHLHRPARERDARATRRSQRQDLRARWQGARPRGGHLACSHLRARPRAGLCARSGVDRSPCRMMLSPFARWWCGCRGAGGRGPVARARRGRMDGPGGALSSTVVATKKM